MAQKAEEDQVKKFMFLVLVLIVPSLAFSQDCGQGKTKDFYILPVILGMDEGQGGSVVEKVDEERSHVINGYDFQLLQTNLSAGGWCIGSVSFRMLENGRNFTPLKVWGVIEGWERRPFKDENGDNEGGAGVWAHNGNIPPFGRKTLTTTMAPGFPGFRLGMVNVHDFEQNEAVITTGTVRLWKDGEVVSQFGVKPVEARTINIVPVFSAERDSQRTGIAIGNQHFEDVKIAIQLFDNEGREIGRREETLTKYAYFARFVNELFPIVEQSPQWQRLRVFEGLVKVTSSKEIPVSAIDGRVSRGMFLMSPLASSGGK